MSSGTRGGLADALRQALDVAIAQIAHAATDGGNPGLAVEGQEKQEDALNVAQVAPAAQPRATADGAGAPLEIGTAAEDNAERDAIQAEAPLPARGTPERIRSDKQHRRYVAGLLRAATWPRP